jgi:hypothetical protein
MNRGHRQRCTGRVDLMAARARSHKPHYVKSRACGIILEFCTAGTCRCLWLVTSSARTCCGTPVRSWPMAETTAANRGVRLQTINLPAARPLRQSRFGAPRGRGARRAGRQIIPPDATGSRDQGAATAASSLGRAVPLARADTRPRCCHGGERRQQPPGRPDRVLNDAQIASIKARLTGISTASDRSPDGVNTSRSNSASPISGGIGHALALHDR